MEQLGHALVRAAALNVAALMLGGCVTGPASPPKSPASALATPAAPVSKEGVSVEGNVDLAHQGGVTRLCLRWAQSDPPQCHDGVEVHGDIAWDALGVDEKQASAEWFVAPNVRVVGRYASGVLALSQAPTLAQPQTASPRAQGGAPAEELEASRRLIETRFSAEVSEGRLLVLVDPLAAGKAHLTVHLIGPDPLVEGALTDMMSGSVPEEAWHVQRLLEPR